MIRGQINNFPEGQFVAVYDGKIVGYCASSRIDEAIALGAARLGADHRQRLRLAPRSDRRLALRLRDVHRSDAARPAHRQAALRGAPRAGRAARAEGHRVRRADAQLRRAPRRKVEDARGLSGAGARGQAQGSGDRLPARQRLRADRRARRAICPRTRNRPASPRTWCGATPMSIRTRRSSSACRAASRACGWPPSSCRRARSRTSPSSSRTSNISSMSRPITAPISSSFPSCSRSRCCRSRPSISRRWRRSTG